MRCVAYGSEIEPSLSWIREQENFTTKLTPYITGQTLFRPVNLTETDEGARFVCYMNHPAFSETRNCSIIPLPAPPKTAPNPIKLIIAIIIILIIIAAVVIVLVIVLMKRRKKKKQDVIPSKINCELTFEGDQPIAAE